MGRASQNASLAVNRAMATKDALIGSVRNVMERATTRRIVQQDCGATDGKAMQEGESTHEEITLRTCGQAIRETREQHLLQWRSEIVPYKHCWIQAPKSTLWM